jgi:peptide-methionine (S)-S-oxide reductase
LQLDFDPAQISYEKLLEVFWQSHNPCQEATSRQYMTAVFYHNEEQKKAAEKTRAAAATREKGKIVTPILAITEFTLAEDYHQKYYLRQNKVLSKELQAYYPDTKDFYASTAVARVNGYLGGFGSAANLQKEIDQLGLSADGKKLLWEVVKRKR